MSAPADSPVFPATSSGSHLALTGRQGPRMIRRFIGIAATLSLSLLPASAVAQTATSVIDGIVRDTSGAALPGATVHVVSEDTHQPVDVVTNPQGEYRVADVFAGRYRVETTLDGFETSVREVALGAGQTVTIDVTLVLARFTEGVVVTARR